jgi:hypothetical protein
MQIVGFLKDKEETDALAALMRLDFARLNEVMAIFRCFIKSAEGNSVSYSNIFPMLQKLMANLGAVRANKHAEALMNAVSRRFSGTRNVNRNIYMLSGDANRENILHATALLGDQASSPQVWERCGRMALLHFRKRFTKTLLR